MGQSSGSPIATRKHRNDFLTTLLFAICKCGLVERVGYWRR